MKILEKVRAIDQTAVFLEGSLTNLFHQLCPRLFLGIVRAAATGQQDCVDDLFQMTVCNIFIVITTATTSPCSVILIRP